MKFFKDSRGFTYTFGFDMVNRKADPTVICWDDMENNWEATPTGLAGWNRLIDINVAPEFICETRDGTVVAYQPGLAIEICFTGHPMIFSFRILRP